MNPKLKYHRLLCFSVVVWLLSLAFGEAILSVGHTLSHASDYISGDLNYHTHSDEKEVNYHNHEILESIGKVIDNDATQEGKPIANQNQNIDNIKLICNESVYCQVEAKPFAGIYYYQLNVGLEYITNTSPPPQYSL